jgi:predicted transcriptional regulator
MQDMQDSFVMTTLEQLKTLSNKVRMRIISLHVDAMPRTLDEMAQELQLPRFKVQLHLQELLRVGLFRVVETEQQDNGSETCYLPVARTFYSPKEWMDDQATHEEAQGKISKVIFDTFVLDYRKAIKEAERLQKAGQETFHLRSDTNAGWLFMTPAQRYEFSRELLTMMEEWEKKYSKKNSVEGALPWQLFCSVLPSDDGADE